MIAATILSFEPETNTGTMVSMDNDAYQFHYEAGQALMTVQGKTAPLFTGHHDQALGYHLKRPCTGDAVIAEVSGGQILRWGYMEHYVGLTEKLRAAGPRFC